MAFSKADFKKRGERKLKQRIKTLKENGRQHMDEDFKLKKYHGV